MDIKSKIMKSIGFIVAVFVGYSFYYATAESLPHFDGFLTALLLIMLLMAVNQDEEEETEEETEE